MPRLRRVNHLCSSTVSGTAYRFRHGSTLCSPTVEKILCRSPYFEAVTCRQSAPDSPRERGDSQEGGNRRCLPSCAPARRQRKSPLRFSENLLPVRGEYAYEVRVPRSIGAERKNTRGIKNASGVTFLSVTRDWMIPFLYVSFQKQV